MPGNRLDAPTFLARYEAMPDGVVAELIEGIVYMPPPVADAHSGPHNKVDFWLAYYEGFTAGVAARTDGMTVLGRRSAPRPDSLLRIIHGGQSRLDDRGLIAGCPELVVEVANSCEAIDLHAKRRDYDRQGALEYVAAVVRNPRVAWFARNGHGRLAEVEPDSDGLYRSRAFPGLWLDPQAVMGGDVPRLIAVLEMGLATPEHATFVADLRTRHR
jgi:Uma2 family endonuclease